MKRQSLCKTRESTSIQTHSDSAFLNDCVPPKSMSVSRFGPLAASLQSLTCTTGFKDLLYILQCDFVTQVYRAK